MTADISRGGWVVINPTTGKRRRFSDEELARRAAAKLNEWLENERQAAAWADQRPTVAVLVDRWEHERLPHKPWDEGTRRNHRYMLARIKAEIGERIIIRTDCIALEHWMSSFCKTADQWNKWRYILVLLWRLAVSRKLASANEPEKIEPRSTSKKLEANRKVRQPLQVPGFRAIHAQAEPWLQIAMEQSLVSLQARKEICNTLYSDYRNGWLYVIRDKVSGESEMGFIRIALTPELEAIRARSLRDGILSTYLVHRAPARRQRRWMANKPHWTKVNPEYLSKAFAEAREASGVYAHLPAAQRPTFHEIKGLGGRIYADQGVPQASIQALMTHAHRRTTLIYLDKGASGLTDKDYHAVTASGTVAGMLGVEGA